MKLLKLSVGFLIFLSFLQISLAAIYLGTCEGYVFYQNGSLAPGAFVEVDVDGCSTQCNGNYTSDSGGYYVIANLNMDAGDDIDASATLNNHYGENNGVADSFQAAYVNITMCEAPYPPTLINPPGNTHNNSYFLLNWTSGIDPNSLSTYDDFIFDGVVTSSASAPQIKQNLVPFKVYTWGVRTCNVGCCSQYNMSSFNLFNGVPPAPILTDQPNTVNNNVTLYWVSGGPDPDGDSVYFEYRFDGVVQSNVTSPQNESGISSGGHTWCVRACDPWECSSWVCDSFSVVNNPPSAPVLVDQLDTDASSVNLVWTSGVDPDGDTTYDEFEFDGTVYSNVSSPQVFNFNDTDTHVWRVRTCDVKGACSNWVSDSFIRCECGSCPILPGSTDRGRDRYRSPGFYCPPGYAEDGEDGDGAGAGAATTRLFVHSPFRIVSGEEFLIRVVFTSGRRINDFKVGVLGPDGIVVDDYIYGILPKAEKVSFDMRGRVDESVKAQEYQMMLVLYNGDDILVSEEFELSIIDEEIPFSLDKCRELLGVDNFWRVLIMWSIFICLAIMAITLRRYVKRRVNSDNDDLLKKYLRIGILVYVILIILLVILFWVVKCYG